MAELRTTCVVYGPDGTRVEPGEQIPDGWDRVYVESLIRDGAASITDAELVNQPVSTIVSASMKG